MEAPTEEQEGIIRMRAAGGEGELAQDRDVDVGVPARDDFPELIGEAGGLEGGAEFEQRVGGADFLERDDIGVEGAQALANLRLAFG